MTTSVSIGPARLTTSRLILTYALGFALFILLPVALSEADTFKGLTWGDIVDAPIVILPVALLFRMALDANLGRATGLRVSVLLALLLFLQGHAIHLAANAISHSLGTADAAWEPAYFLDENVGHYELQLSLISLAGLFIWYGRPSPLTLPELPLLALAIAGYGSLSAADAIEGQTVPFVLPASLALALIGTRIAVRHRDEYVVFFTGSYAVCFLGLVVYGAINGGWPEIL